MLYCLARKCIETVMLTTDNDAARVPIMSQIDIQFDSLKYVANGGIHFEQDDILVILSELLSEFENGNSVSVKVDDDSIGLILKLISMDDEMVSFLSFKILTNLLKTYHHLEFPKCFDLKLLEFVLKAFNYCNKRNSESGNMLHIESAHAAFILGGVKLITKHFSQHSSNYGNYSSSNMKQFLSILYVMLLLMKIYTKLLVSTENGITLTGDFFIHKLSHSYISLMKFFFKFIQLFMRIGDYFTNTHCCILWRLGLKSLNKIFFVSTIIKNSQISSYCKILCYKMCSCLTSFQVQSELKLIQADFVGPLDEVLSDKIFTFDDTVGRKLILFLLQTLSKIVAGEIHLGFAESYLSSILNLLQAFQPENGGTVDNTSSVELLDIFIEQDDLLINILSVLLELFCSLRNSCSTLPLCMNPHILFSRLLHHVAYDENVLLDWLISSESRLFLTYLTHYLHTVKESFNEFVSIINDEIQLGNDILIKSQGDLNSFNEKSQRDISGDILSNSKDIYYSSSPNEEVGSKVTNFEKIMSCLIRLLLKLDRLKSQSLLNRNFNGLVSVLNEIELLYEEY